MSNLEGGYRGVKGVKTRSQHAHRGYEADAKKWLVREKDLEKRPGNTPTHLQCLGDRPRAVGADLVLGQVQRLQSFVVLQEWTRQARNEHFGGWLPGVERYANGGTGKRLRQKYTRKTPNQATRC